MNVILIHQKQDTLSISRSDPRYKHIRSVLKMGVGDSLDIGVINGPRGKAKLECIDKEKLDMSVSWGNTPPSLSAVEVIIGIPRPQTARKMLNTLTTIGVKAFHFFQSDKGEPSYSESKLWQTDEWQRHLHEGAEQSFSTHIPTVKHYKNLEEALENVSCPCIGLDNYEATGSLAERKSGKKEIALIIGSERGFSAEERNLMRERKIPILHMGKRVLRAETAATIACGLLMAQTDYWES
jgi:RsmE family RNA methyltransferase